MRSPQPFSIIHIQWIDSIHTAGGWQSESSTKSRRDWLLFETVGFLFKETTYSYVIVQSKHLYRDNDGSDSVDAVMEIPKCAVLKLKTVAPPTALR